MDRKRRKGGREGRKEGRREERNGLTGLILFTSHDTSLEYFLFLHPFHSSKPEA